MLLVIVDAAASSTDAYVLGKSLSEGTQGRYTGDAEVVVVVVVAVESG